MAFWSQMMNKQKRDAEKARERSEGPNLVGAEVAGDFTDTCSVCSETWPQEQLKTGLGPERVCPRCEPDLVLASGAAQQRIVVVGVLLLALGLAALYVML